MSFVRAVIRTLKQAATLKRLGLPFSDFERRRRGFVILQIDALSHQDLTSALSAGHLPRLQRLIEAGKYRIESWRCGMPSDTAAIQCGMWYGDKSYVPGFYWYDKRQRKPIIVSWPMDMARIETLCAGEREGLLRHGSVYTGLVAGGASRAVFTTSALGRATFPPKLTGIDIFLLMLLHPWRLGRLVYLTFAELFTEVVEQGQARARGGYVAPEGIFPITRVFTHILFRELSALGVRLDVFRGVPAIYANFIGYDEIAHHLGPDSTYAYRALKAIDRQIYDVYQAVQASRIRKYDLIIMSDHGMTRSVPFQHLYGQTLGQFMSEHSAGNLHTADLESRSQKDRSVMQHVGELSDEVGPRTSSFTRKALDRLARVGMMIGTGPMQAGLSENANSPILAVYSSALANVYFTRVADRVDISDIERMAPGLLDAVVRHEGIGIVVGREGNQTVVVTSDGLVTLESATLDELEFLRLYDEPEIIANQLRELAAVPNSGDLLVFGAYRDGLVVNFEDHAGAHGGLGGVQAHPFMAIPRDAEYSVSEVEDATELNRIFEESYWRREGLTLVKPAPNRREQRDTDSDRKEQPA